MYPDSDKTSLYVIIDKKYHEAFFNNSKLMVNFPGKINFKYYDGLEKDFGIILDTENNENNVSSFLKEINSDNKDSEKFCLDTIKASKLKETRIKSILNFLKTQAKSNEGDINKLSLILLDKEEDIDEVVSEVINYIYHPSNKYFSVPDYSLSYFSINKNKEMIMEFINI